ncbi:MAG: MutS2/Smr-associated SH3 domain-containing protein, partial [Chitinophagaceae bacterium]
ELELQLDRERHRQKMDLLRQQNRITEERLQYLKEMERKLKQITIDWKKAEQQEDKRALIRQLRLLLFTPNPKKTTDQPVKPKEPFTETQEPVEVGKKVRIVNSTQTGQVIEIRGRKVVVQVGNLPMILSPKDIRVIQERPKK